MENNDNCKKSGGINNKNIQHEKHIHRINYLTSEMNSLYHKASLKLGLSDTVSMVLYTIYDIGKNECLLADIYKNSGISRQTVNSAVRKLEKEDVIYLEQYKGKAKKVILTPKGEEYMERTVARLFAAELAAYETWTDDEISAYIGLTEKYTECLRKQVDRLMNSDDL